MFSENDDPSNERSLNITIAAGSVIANTIGSTTQSESLQPKTCIEKFEETLSNSKWKQTKQKNAAKYYDSIGYAF